MTIKSRTRLKQRGDTLVEVLLSTVVLSIVLAGAYTLSNRATRINQQAYERTKVSNLIQEQAEFLRALRDSDTGNDPSSVWQTVLSNHTNISAASTTCKTVPSSGIGGLATGSMFYLESNGSNIVIRDTPTKYKLAGGKFYIWVQGVSSGASSSFADFVINACWEGLSTAENQQSGLVIRLEKLN
jgi:prepilin-type N-terminal cleavage/methylation domain-containing protein